MKTQCSQRSARFLFARSLAVGAIAFASASAGAAHAATPASGDLIKLSGSTAVYYVGADQKRYVFPNLATYHTWYADFAGVKTVGAADLAALPIGGNVTYRPGTRLVKITSDPKVYAVEPGGSLRAVASESVAAALYGPQWAQKVDDVPDAFFFNYAIGSPLASATYPDGSVVRRARDGMYFMISGGRKRHIISADVRAALRIQDASVLVAQGSLAEYPDGADLAATEAALTDTAQKGGAAIPATPTFSVKDPPSAFIPISGEATLLEIHLATPTALSVNAIAIRIDALTDTHAKDAVDADLGGLVRGNNADWNLANLRLVDAHGAEPFGRKNLSLDVSQDQSQVVTFTGSLPIGAGTDQSFFLRADAHDLLPEGEGYRATLLPARTALRDAATGAAVAFLPATDLAGSTLTSRSSSLAVTYDAATVSRTVIRGAKDVPIAGFTFTAPANTAATVSSLTLQGYGDEEGIGGFLPGGDADNGTQTLVKDVFPRVWLADSAGKPVTPVTSVQLDGRVTFSGLGIVIQPGAAKTLVIRGDCDRDVDLETAPNLIAFDITDSSVVVTAQDGNGAKLTAHGIEPNGGVKPRNYVTIKKNGTADISWAGGGGQVLAGTDALSGTLYIQPKDDAFVLKTVTFTQIGGKAASIGSAHLEYVGTDGKAATATSDFIGNVITFTGLSAALPKDAHTGVKLVLGILPRGGGAVYGETAKLRFETAGPFEIDSVTDGRPYTASDLGGTDFRVTSSSDSTVSVIFSTLTVAQATAIPGIAYRDPQAPVLDFTIAAGDQGGIRIKKLTFQLTPTDAGTAGAGNDALERWAAVNGDFPNDTGVADLVFIPPAGGTKSVIGEDGSTRMSYGMLVGGTPSTVSSTLQSTQGQSATLTYEFADGSEYSIGAGGKLRFQLQMNLATLNADSDRQLTVQLLGGSGLLWTDIPSGAYAARSDAAGTPLSTTVLVRK
ncbi:MAG: hypothetical protein RLZZ324_120 [Candidatus Parcubacteria bacterium]|jgi:hypothetical protein